VALVLGACASIVIWWGLDHDDLAVGLAGEARPFRGAALSHCNVPHSQRTDVPPGPAIAGPRRPGRAHHLALVGRTDTMISDDAAELIHTTSRGLPRAVNNLAMQALVATYLTNKTIVDTTAARAAVTDVTAD
jgi:hypothetical protein